MTQTELNEELFHINRIFGEAVNEARKENSKHGLPSPFALNGKKYYVLADGTITHIRPAILDRAVVQVEK